MPVCHLGKTSHYLYLNPLAHLVGKHNCPYVQRLRVSSKRQLKKIINLSVQAALEFII